VSIESTTTTEPTLTSKMQQTIENKAKIEKNTNTYLPIATRNQQKNKNSTNN